MEGYVEKNVTGTIIDPGTPVGNITQAIATANAAATSAASAAAEAFEAASEAEEYADSIAPNYADVEFPVAAGGQLCWHEGALYVSLVDISSAENWTSAHWAATDVSTEIGKRVVATTAETRTYLGIT